MATTKSCLERRTDIVLGCARIALLALIAWCCAADRLHAQSGSRGAGGNPGGTLFSKKEKPVAPSGLSLTATDQLVAAIRVEGARHIPASKVLSQLQTRIGRPYDPQLLQRDVKKLHSLPWFVSVETYTESSPEGRVVIFRVTERPTIRYIEYLGNNKIRDKKLAKETGLKVGGAISPYAVEEGRARIAALYAENGFNRVQVTVVEGTDSTDSGVVYAINEGKSQKIWSVKFEGNSFASSGQLKTKVQTKPGFARVFKGYVDYETIQSDLVRLTDYYRQYGFFQAKVGRVIDWNDQETWATIRFVIHEGPRSRVRNVSVVGNELFATKDLRAGFKLPGGESFERAKVTGDVEWLKELYGSRGYVFTDIKPSVRYLEQPGEVDLVYTINEGKRFRVGRVFVHIGGDNPHTQIQTALNRLSIKPGEIIDIREVRASERRLQASSLFLADAARNIFPKISFRIPESDDGYFSANQQPVVRGQSPEAVPVTKVAGKSGSYEVRHPVLSSVEDSLMDVHLHIEKITSSDSQKTKASESSPVPERRSDSGREIIVSSPKVHVVRKPPLGWGNERGQENKAYSRLSVDSTNPYQPQVQPTPIVYRGQSPGGARSSIGWTSGNEASRATARATDVGGTMVQATGPQSVVHGGGFVRPAQYVENIPPPGLPPAAGQLPPSSLITPFPVHEGIGPGLQGLPTAQFTDPAVDVYVDLEETQTGRFLLGVGINSDAGIVGQILLDERNFDWRRPPSSWQDVVDGTAWRGAGQRFRIEAAPGSQVQRYLVNFQEPFLMGTPVSLGLGGSFFDRRFNDWNEQRLGVRASLGYQWVQSDVSTSFSYRGERVNIGNPSNAAEPQLAEVLGDNSLHGFRASVINDTRDNTFLATQGHYLEVWGEAVVGTFDYPRGGFDFRKYFLMRERPDHSGRHVLSATTKLQLSGSNTPVYDQFFAGGFSTMRGFDFRGASPVSNGVQVGGEFSWINSVEYLFPITADDMLRGVVFCDFGTVAPSVALDDFRVAPGVGLRITVPALGPAPIALDFAVPVARADTDDLQVFSFNIGFLR